jgi:hypothetical protein
MKVSAENKARIKSCIKSIPKSVYDYDNGSPYELMIYVKKEMPWGWDWDLSNFDYFKNMKELENAIQRNIQQYGSELNHIDFKWSEEEDEYDQFTIYKA